MYWALCLSCMEAPRTRTSTRPPPFHSAAPCPYTFADHPQKTYPCKDREGRPYNIHLRVTQAIWYCTGDPRGRPGRVYPIAQTCTVLASPAEAIRLPSGDHETERTQSL